MLEWDVLEGIERILWLWLGLNAWYLEIILQGLRLSL
jgi:hypothetical protein